MEEETKNPVNIYKKSDINPDAKRLDELDVNTISLALTAKNEKKMEEVNFLLGEARDYIERFEKGKKYDFYRVDDIFVDLTEVINELKEYDNIDLSKIKKAEEVRKALRYVVTAKTNANKLMKEITQKREKSKLKLEAKEFQDRYNQLKQKHEQEIQELTNKFGIPTDFEDHLDDFFEEDDAEELAKLKEMQAEMDSNANTAEKEAKELVKYIRELLKEFYELPEKVIDEVNITVKAMGAVASVVQKYSKPNITKANLQKALENPQIKELLEPYITEGFKFDQVNIVNDKIPKVSKFFGEAQNKIVGIIDDISEVDDEVSQKDKDNISEGVMGDAFKTVATTIINAISKTSKMLKSTIKSLKNSVFRDGSEIENAITKFNSEHSKRLKNAQRLYLDLETEMSELSLNTLREGDQE